MKDYHINVFWSEEDESYVADIPDLFPCTATGDSPEEALAEVLVQSSRCPPSAPSPTFSMRPNGPGG